MLKCSFRNQLYNYQIPNTKHTNNTFSNINQSKKKTFLLTANHNAKISSKILKTCFQRFYASECYRKQGLTLSACLQRLYALQIQHLLKDVKKLNGQRTI